jgi:hypothetical protein
MRLKKKKRKIKSNCNVPPKTTMLDLIIRMKKKRMEIYLEKCLCMVHFVLLFIWVKANKLFIPTLHLHWVFMEGLVQKSFKLLKVQNIFKIMQEFS